MTEEKPIIEMMSKDEKFWSDIIERTEHEIESMEKMLTFHRAVLEMAQVKKADYATPKEVNYI